MAYDINLALNRLEKNLENLDSARTQVQQTVDTSIRLQSIVAGYTSSLDSTRSLVKGLVDDIGNYKTIKDSEIGEREENLVSVCDSIEDEFRDRVNNVVETLNVCLNDKISKFDQENSKLEEQVKSLNGLQDELVVAIGEVKEIKKQLDVISSELASSQKAQDTCLSNILDYVQKSNLDLAAIKTSVGTVAEKKDIQNTQCLVKESTGEIVKSTKALRWTVLAGIFIIVILCILQFIY